MNTVLEASLLRVLCVLCVGSMTSAALWIAPQAISVDPCSWMPAGLSATCAASSEQQYQVLLTRERGKNGKLMAALQKRGISVLEMPLVETTPGPDRDQLPAVLQRGGFDWIVITSPEAAAVLLKGWESANRPQVNLHAPASLSVCHLPALPV